MRINRGRATYSHFSMVDHTDEAMLLPAGRVPKRVRPTNPTMKREKANPNPRGQGQEKYAKHNAGHYQEICFHYTTSSRVLIARQVLMLVAINWIRKMLAPVSIRAWGIHKGVFVRVPEVDSYRKVDFTILNRNHHRYPMKAVVIIVATKVMILAALGAKSPGSG